MSIRQGNKIIAGNVDNTDYTALLNKPQINSVELNGNKTLEDLGIQASGDYATTEDTNEIKENYNKLDNQKTNCITKISQDIKLELSEDGTLTKKAGTKFYIPNGFEEDGTTPKFDILVLDKDYSGTGASTSVGTLLQITNPSNLPDFPRVYVENSYSGETAPSGAGYIFWYDTANNLVKLTADGGNNWEPGYSLPYAITTENGSKYTSIDQVFNGFGYIGSTIFSLPGVEGLIPNGRNADGSLNNTKFTTTSVLTIQTDFTGNHYIMLGSNFIGEYGSELTIYNENKNLNFDSYANTAVSLCNCGLCVLESGRITSFNPKTTFQAVDINDTKWASTQSKPSNRYVDLQLQANGAQYTAPFNGWIQLIKTPTSANQYLVANSLDIPNTGTDTNNIAFKWSNGNGLNDGIFFPVRKGQQFTIGYTFGGATVSFKFIYDEGAK